jgi:preprotein translocase subunit SecD
MGQRYNIYLLVILVLMAAVIWIVLPNNPGISIGGFQRSLQTQLGLDLRGGLRVLLEADLPAETQISQEDLKQAQGILESRSNGLGVSEVVFQIVVLLASSRV